MGKILIFGQKEMRLTEEEFLAIAKAKYVLMTEQLKDEEVDFYEYESRLDVLMTEWSRSILESSLSETEVSVDKKKRYKQDSEKLD